MRSVLKRRTIEIINTVISVTSGYARVDDPRIKPTSKAFVQQAYGGSSQSIGYWFTTQVQAGGYMYIYVRESSRTLPANGTEITVNILIV